MSEPSAAMKKVLNTPITFDMLRDPNWTPSRDDYRSMRDAAVSLSERLDRQGEALRGLAVTASRYLDTGRGDLDGAIEVARAALSVRSEEA